jgi:hypothetical protein
MKKAFTLLMMSIGVFAINAQVIQTRLLEVSPADMDKFVAAASKKTKMYNSKPDQPRYLTFEILSGKYANNFVRVQYGDSLAVFDDVDTVGNAYWQKTTGNLHTSTGNRIWGLVKSATHAPETADYEDLRRVIYYNFSDEGSDDFWRFRERVKKAMEASGYNHRMGVWWCASGCDGNVVMVRFHHKDFAGQAEDYGQPLADMIAKYEEMYGEGSYEQDSDKVDASLLENGRKFRHYRFRPEMSSPRN